MLKVIVMAVLVLGAGALGYLGERFMRPTAAPPPEHAPMEKTKKLLFKLPLGKFTMQIIQTKSTMHLAFDLDVYVMGEGAFQGINGAVGRAKLRDATVTAIAELAETDHDLAETEDDAGRMEQLAEKLVRKLYVDFPEIRTARINKLTANVSLREQP